MLQYVLFYVGTELTDNNWLLSRFSGLLKFENACESSAVRRFTKRYLVKNTEISNMSFAASYRCVFFRGYLNRRWFCWNECFIFMKFVF